MRTNPLTSDVSAILAALAADCLNIPPGELSRQVPLTRYGLDSLATEQLAAAIEQRFGRRIHASVLLEHPDLESLERYLSLPEEGAASPDIRQLIAGDAKLADDIRPGPATGAAGTVETVLLSGATGFLGAYLLRSLLRNTRSTVCCIARSSARESASERVRSTLQRYGIWEPAWQPRLRVMEGDLALPQLGVGTAEYLALCREVDAVYHCAATVNWIYPYASLRQVNVLGTGEMLRLACTLRPKPFHFVSSASVCYSTWGPLDVDESCDVSPYLHGLHLGYAQTKSVAESLVRQAGSRGLPVTIHRPSLLTGDRTSGSANLDDLLSRLIKGIILMGGAPDLDWSVDCCPVDYVADAILHLTTSPAPPEVSHLVNPAPRHWRELVLWINLFGYPVRLVPYREWLTRLREDAASPGHPLSSLLDFFTREPEGEGGLTLPELYEDGRRSRIRSAGTAVSLRGGDHGSPSLNARLLDRYFRHYLDEGFLQPTAFSLRAGRPEPEESFDAGFYTALMRLHCNDPRVEVRAVRHVPKEGTHSIITELSSWKYGGSTGIDRYRLSLDRGGGEECLKPVVLKRKARDEHLIDTAQQIAGLCSEKLGRAFGRFGRDIGLSGSHLREIGIYRQNDERFLRHTPALYGARSDEGQGVWALVLEDISELELLDSADSVADWRPEHLEAAVGGLAELHSIWYRREDELLAQPWLGRVLSARRREEMPELWLALAENAAARFRPVLGPGAQTLQRRLIARLPDRWRCLDRLPRTLIHNDFNARNLAFRRQEGKLRLCAYDWELATLGAPQHDLAELLCFVLNPGVARPEVMLYLDLHRTALEQAADCSIDPGAWETGFRLSLHDLLVDRLAIYAMIDRFCPQRFLTRVVSTWQALYELFPLDEA